MTSEVKNNLEISGLTVNTQNILETLANKNNIKSIYKLYILERRKNYHICIQIDNIFRKSKIAN